MPLVLRLLLLFILYASALIFVHYYNGLERFFPFWDMRFYHDLTIQGWRHFATSWSDWLSFLKQKLGDDYNANFTVPLLLPISLFGDSRHVYVSSLVAFYLLPCCLLIGAIAREITTSKPWMIFYLATAIALLTPGPWRPTLVGYPDAGGAALLGAAVWVYVRDVDWRRWWSAPLLGVFVALSILFRRHFSYAGVALYGAIFLSGLWQNSTARAAWPDKRKAILRLVAFLALACAAQMVVMLLIAPEFTIRILVTDYTAVYASYRRSATENLRMMRDGFGDIFLALALCGFALAWWRNMVARGLIIFFMLFLILWLSEWLLIARQATSHVFLHALLFTAALGVALAVYGVWGYRNIFARTMAALLFMAVSASFLHTFVLYALPLSQGLAHFTPLLPAQIPPPRGHALDYDTYIDLVRYLRAQARSNDRVYVAASSGQLNEDVLRSAEEVAGSATGASLRFLDVAHVDSRDRLPVTELIQADIVVVAAPVQYSLPPAEQDVIRMAVETFVNHWELSQDFVQLPRVFVFQTGFEVKLYRRERRVSRVGTIIRTLARMRQELGGGADPMPASQQDWISLDPSERIQIVGGARQPERLIARHVTGEIPSAPPASVLYIHPLGATNRFDGMAMASGDCQEAVLEIVTLAPDDRERVIAQRALPLEQRQAFDFRLDAPGSYLMLNIRIPPARPPAGECVIDLDQLRVLG